MKKFYEKVVVWSSNNDDSDDVSVKKNFNFQRTL